MNHDLSFIYDRSIAEYENTDPNIIARDTDNQMLWPVRLQESARFARRAVNAILVIVNTSHIQEYLIENDPKAYEQCLKAIGSNPASDAALQDAIRDARAFIARHDEPVEG